MNSIIEDSVPTKMVLKQEHDLDQENLEQGNLEQGNLEQEIYTDSNTKEHIYNPFYE